MRPDAFGPRTWLLAVVAGWAVLLALLALFGLAGRITPMADDPALVQALPKLTAPAPERLGPLSQYADIAARPLFSENRQPQPFYIAGKEEASAAPASFDWVLSSVLITPQVKLAILQTPQGGEGVRVKLGEELTGQSGWRLAELQPRSAVFEGPGGRRALELRVFDGSGGVPPTQVRAATPPVTPPGAARVTGGAAVPTPMAPNAPATAQNQPPDPPPAPPQSTEEQMEAIRKRIEARRAQMRQQQAQPTPPPPTAPDKTQ
ncbi:hypothetical protein [Pseudoxanthomonas sp. UTMC 1351]|uniref:hypothetical protein n=1 Tax=Pseudoxanthomonas sp. UTMC 1351 TaxID=2695853 RepID=UPI0034CF7FBB